MSKELKNYRTTPPMTADALILVVNEFLSDRGALLISKRTLRFYTSQGVVPHPLGSPKLARYGYEHLLSLLASRALQDQGQRIDNIRMEVAEIARGRYDRLETVVVHWLSQASEKPGRVMKVREGAAGKPANMNDPFTILTKRGSTGVKIQISPSCTLEVSDTVNVRRDLKSALKELTRIVEELPEE